MKLYFLLIGIFSSVRCIQEVYMQFQSLELVFDPWDSNNMSRSFESIQLMTDKENKTIKVNALTNKNDYLIIDAADQIQKFDSYIFTLNYNMSSVKTKDVYNAKFNLTYSIKNLTTNNDPKIVSLTQIPVIQFNPTNTSFESFKINATMIYSVIVHSESTTVKHVNNHSAAVVFAVIEGLLLGAILLVFACKMYKKMRYRTAGMPYPENNINSAFSANINNPRQTSYYDSQPPRRSENTNAPVPQSPGYGYDQPPLELNNRSSNLSTGRNMASRVEAQTPSLVPVSATSINQPSGDPLRAWDAR